MDKQDIIRMARDAGLMGNPLAYANWYPEALERFAALVAAAEQKKWQDQTAVEIHEAVLDEREACAKVAAKTVCDIHLPTGIKIYGTQVATAIRARGNV